jgi:hypothetical protein
MILDEDLVYIAVPRALYPEVVRRVSEHLNPDPTAGPRPAASKPAATGNGQPAPHAAGGGPELTEELVQRIFIESKDTHRRLLKLLAEYPDKWMSYEEVSRLMGFRNPRQLPGTLGAYSRRSTHRYGGAWPFKWRQSAGQWELCMKQDTADLIREL